MPSPVAGVLICVAAPFLPDLDSGAGPADNVATDASPGGASAGWSSLQKFSLFGILVAALAIYVRASNRNSRDSVGYQKTMA